MTRIRTKRGVGLLEGLMILGIVSLFVWPFLQLWSIRAVPLFVSDAHRQAAVALENLMAEALARPYVALDRSKSFLPLVGGESIGLQGKIEVVPHPEFRGLNVVRARVRWGSLLFRKYLTLEAIVSQDHA